MTMTSVADGANSRRWARGGANPSDEFQPLFDYPTRQFLVSPLAAIATLPFRFLSTLRTFPRTRHRSIPSFPMKQSLLYHLYQSPFALTKTKRASSQFCGLSLRNITTAYHRVPRPLGALRGMRRPSRSRIAVWCHLPRRLHRPQTRSAGLWPTPNLVALPAFKELNPRTRPTKDLDR